MAIAKAVNCDRETVAVVRNELAVDTKESLQLLEPDAVEGWQTAIAVSAAKGDHRPAKELLQSTGKVERDRVDGGQAGMTLVVLMPNQPLPPQLQMARLPIPDIALSPVSVRELPDLSTG